MYKTILFSENEKDVVVKLQEKGLNIPNLETKFSTLFSRVANNYVGYYLYQHDDFVYKILVLPKIISKYDNKAEKKFIIYLLHYYRLNAEYGFDLSKKIAGSLISLVYESHKNKDFSHLPVEQFEYYRHHSTIKSIFTFFKRYKNYKKNKQDYVSQAIRHKLNISKNIYETNKTKIHQLKYTDSQYSKMATITYHTIKLFEKNKIRSLKKDKQIQIMYITNKLKQFLVKKFDIDRSYKINISKLMSTKVAKSFKSKTKYKDLYLELQSLFGFENFYNSSELGIDRNYNLTTSALFIDPIIFYEWYVYDVFKQKIKHSNQTLRFDKKEKTSQDFYIFYNKEHISMTSNPDYVIFNKERVPEVVIDAKWKNIYNYSSINSMDILKLKRDTNLRAVQNDTSLKAYFVYPFISNKHIIEKQLTLSYLENDPTGLFTFTILEIKFDLENLENTDEIDLEFIRDKIYL